MPPIERLNHGIEVHNSNPHPHNEMMRDTTKVGGVLTGGLILAAIIPEAVDFILFLTATAASVYAGKLDHNRAVNRSMYSAGNNSMEHNIPLQHPQAR